MKTYPAIFHKEEDESGYSVTFPNLPIVTCGDTLDEAKKMAGDVLYLWLSEEDRGIFDLNEPSSLEEIQKSTTDLVFMIKPEIYFNNYSRMITIERCMEKQDLTTQTLSKLLNITERKLIKIINSEELPTKEVAEKMADILDFDFEVIFFNKKYLHKKY